MITGDKKGAGTDANVSITIFGKSGQTDKLPLKSKSKNVFERNQSDIFTMKAKCVGPMTKIRIEHDNSGAAAGWYLERVSDKCPPYTGSKYSQCLLFDVVIKSTNYH